MPLVLLDEGVPVGIQPYLTGFTVLTVAEQGWAGLVNGKLIAATEAAGFDIVITCDQQWQHQQNLGGRRIAVVVLETTNWLVIRAGIAGVVAAVTAATPGNYTSIPFPRPALNRRPPPPGYER
jgi:hypothetical protein